MISNQEIIEEDNIEEQIMKEYIKKKKVPQKKLFRKLCHSAIYSTKIHFTRLEYTKARLTNSEGSINKKRRGSGNSTTSLSKNNNITKKRRFIDPRKSLLLVRRHSVASIGRQGSSSGRDITDKKTFHGMSQDQMTQAMINKANQLSNMSNQDKYRNFIKDGRSLNESTHANYDSNGRGETVTKNRINIHKCSFNKRLSSSSSSSMIDDDDYSRYCRLKNITCVMYFVKEVYYNNGSMNTQQKAIYEDLKRKSSEDWSRKVPFHMCVWEKNQFEKKTDAFGRLNSSLPSKPLLCDESSGCGHCQFFDTVGLGNESIINYHNNIGTSTKGNIIKVSNNDILFDPHQMIDCWNKQDEELYFRENSNGGYIPIRGESGQITIRDFASINGVRLVLHWVRLYDLDFCPLEVNYQGPHDCRRSGCYKINKDRSVVCLMTGKISSRDDAEKLSGGYQKQGVSKSTRQSESYEIERLRKSMNDRSVGTLGKMKSMIRKSKFSLKEIERFLESKEDVNELYESVFNKYDKNRTNSSGQSRSVSEKRDKNRQRQKAIISSLRGDTITSEKSLKRIKNGNWTTPDEYYNVCRLKIMSIILFNDQSRQAQIDIINESERKNYEFRVNKYKLLTAATNDRIDIDDKKEESLPSCRKLVLLSSSSSSSSSSSHHKNGENGKSISELVKYNFVTTKPEKIDIIIKSQVEELVKRCIDFWIILRTRTEDGTKNDNLFPFESFIFAFVYILRDGFSIKSAFNKSIEKREKKSIRDNVSGRSLIKRRQNKNESDFNDITTSRKIGNEIVEFFEKNKFLSKSLPPIDDLFSIHGDIPPLSQVKKVIKQVKKTIRKEITDRGTDFHFLNPFENHYDDDCISQELSKNPCLFISIRRNRKNRY